MTETYTQHPDMTVQRQSSVSRALLFGLPQRLASIAALLALELIAFSTWLDTRALQGNGKPAMRAVVAFSAFFLTFGYLRSQNALQRISDQLVGTPVKWGFVAGHLGAMAALGASTSFSLLDGWQFRGGVFVVGAFGIALVGTAFIPFRVWINLLRSTGTAWAYAAGATLAALELISQSASLWQPATRLTFNLVTMLLHPFLPDLIADPVTATIGTHKFAATIAAACSGIEGVGLIFVFSVSWLWFFRRECRFPQTLLLIPGGVCILWLLNVVRIAALVLIGNAGAQSVAVGGFHSQAGWIAFNAVALGFSLAAQRVPWFSRKPREKAVKAISTENPTAAYLTPFLAILAAAMIARATSGTFEWLYPLRFFAAAGALWFFWPRYAKLNWKFGWMAPVAGALVFALWLALDMVTGVHTKSPMPESLATLPALGRIAWIVFRTLAAVITVPIAEELAFRGFLLRRLISADFESVGTRTFAIVSFVVSSVAFGLLHGDRWLAGAVAGAVYAGVLLWRGRIGDAVVAHAVSNALIAVFVLAGGNWQLW